MSFDRWRSLVDGAEIDVGPDIPDSEVYLHDDWGDNKLQDREDSGTTTHNGVEGVYRPEWETPSGRSTPTVDDEELQIRGDDAIYTSINLNLDEEITWEWTNVFITGGTTDRTGAHLWTEQIDEISEDRFHDSYYLSLQEGFDLRLRHVDSSGDVTNLIEGPDVDEGRYDLRVTRSPSGEFEFFVDDTPEGTATDTSLTDPQYIAFAGEDDPDTRGDFDELKVF